MNKLLDKIAYWYFSKKSLPYWGMYVIDSIIVLLSGLFSLWFLNRDVLLNANSNTIVASILFYIAISWIGALAFRTYLGIVRYSSFIDLLKIVYANALSMLIALLCSFAVEQYQIKILTGFNQTGIVLMFMVSTLFMCFIRIVVKNIHDSSQSDDKALRVLIYGALSGGIGLAKNIRSQKPVKFQLCGFISHDNRAQHMTLLGEKLYNINDDLESVVLQKKIQAVIVSPLRINDFRNNQYLQDLLLKLGIKIYFAHQAEEANLKDGEWTDELYQSLQFRVVSVEDLLPRSEIEIDMTSVGEMLFNTRILVTGSAGSIGSELVRQISHFKPKAMMLIDQAETPEHDVRLMMKKDYPDIDAETVVTTICREDRMEKIFSEFKPDYVFHAAAYKHVPMMEDNPSEAVLNNIVGTKIIADLSVKYHVKKFVMVSTDKAVNPTNVMGCSKRICEIYVQSLSQKQNICQFVTTRFGNVLGSNGSVIPLFREQIKNGGPVTVTDERIERYFMLIPEACKLVLEAGTKGHGGEIFVFDMGQPVKIIDLAKRMIALSGTKDIKIEITGLREGEKLFEEVLNELEGTKPSFHEKIKIAKVRQYNYEDIKKEIDDLIMISHQYDNMKTVAKMKEIVPEYKSNHSLYEILDRR